MKRRKKRVLSVAPTVSRHQAVQNIEGPAHEMFFLKKTYREHGAEAASDALALLARRGNDPSEASAIAFAGVTLADSALDSRVSSQEWRRSGGNTRGQQRIRDAEPDYENIRQRATHLLSVREPHEIVGVIERATRFSTTKIRRALALHPSGHWNKKK